MTLRPAAATQVTALLMSLDRSFWLTSVRVNGTVGFSSGGVVAASFHRRYTDMCVVILLPLGYTASSLGGGGKDMWRSRGTAALVSIMFWQVGTSKYNVHWLAQDLLLQFTN
jgi:hypothetical protein